MSGNVKMINYVFAGDRMSLDLEQQLFNALKEMCTEMAQYMQALCNDKDISGSFRAELADSSVGDFAMKVGSDHWGAFLSNYGMGSLMATESQNPFLADYKSSFFHSYRFDNAIRAREQGYYWRPNWESGDGYRTDLAGGRIPAGTNLETNYSWKAYNIKIRPKKPQFFMETTFAMFEPIIEERVGSIIDNFPYHTYWKGGSYY